VALGSMLGLLVVLAGCRSESRQLELTPLFEKSRTSDLVAGQGALTGSGYDGFRQGQAGAGHWIEGPLELRFFLHRELPLRLTCQVRTDAPAEVQVSLNGAPWPEPLQALPGHEVFELELDTLRPGWNSLTLSSPGPLQWQSALLQPSRAAQSSKTGQLMHPQRQTEGWLLPFGAVLAVPLPPQQTSRLQLAVELWEEEGVAPLSAGQWRLEIQARQDDPGSLLSYEVTQTGSQEFALPAFGQAAMLELRVLPENGHWPLPGQLGVKINHPRLLLDPAKETPQPTARFAGQLQVSEQTVRLGDLEYRARPPSLHDLRQDPERREDLLLQRPATALHLESALPRAGSSSHSPEDDETLRKLRTLEYLR
jgi:hypothetical protein